MIPSGMPSWCSTAYQRPRCVAAAHPPHRLWQRVCRRSRLAGSLDAALSPRVQRFAAAAHLRAGIGQGVVGDPVWQDALVRRCLQELTALCCSSPFAQALSKALQVVTFWRTSWCSMASKSCRAPLGAGLLPQALFKALQVITSSVAANRVRLQSWAQHCRTDVTARPSSLPRH